MDYGNYRKVHEALAHSLSWTQAALSMHYNASIGHREKPAFDLVDLRNLKVAIEVLQERVQEKREDVLLCELTSSASVLRYLALHGIDTVCQLVDDSVWGIWNAARTGKIPAQYHLILLTPEGRQLLLGR